MGMDVLWTAAIAGLWTVMAGLVLAFDKLAAPKGARP
ncbi:MAG: hypothetical protein JWQ88_3003 [Rhodoferax sp.]|nr:hypothetical protein [Rhodoferax sp.]